MKLDFTNFLYALSYALDAAEREITGTTVEHGKRVACMSWFMAADDVYTDLERVDLVTCAILHDNAIIPYIREELEYEIDPEADAEYEVLRKQMGAQAVHAYLGEQKVRKLPLHGNVENVILWHHENADGSGPLGKAEAETNLFSQIIRIADVLDTAYDLQKISKNEYDEMMRMVSDQTGKMFAHEAADMCRRNLTWEKLQDMQQRGPLAVLKEQVPVLEFDYSDAEMTRIASFFAEIVDYKSSFTKDHSIGVAQKAQFMAEHYNFPHDKMVRFAFAGAMHDIGKMVVGNEILEKPDKLTADEFGAMKNHAAETYKILKEIQGFDDIAEWAANHHEKLDGTGYSRRLKAEQQTFEDRLMACIDIYQALTETRPYKDGLSHKRSISIMRSMAEEGKIDAKIVEDMNLAFDNGIEEEIDDSEARLTTKVWKCPVCGYIYEGDTPPASCPICDTDADEFVLQG